MNLINKKAQSLIEFVLLTVSIFTVMLMVTVQINAKVKPNKERVADEYYVPIMR